MNKYTDISSQDFPKTLMIRNHEGGMIWQVYHVDNQEQIEILTDNCWKNQFYGSTLENYQPDYEETFPNWREECSDNLKDTFKTSKTEIIKDNIISFEQALNEADLKTILKQDDSTEAYFQAIVDYLEENYIITAKT